MRQAKRKLKRRGNELYDKYFFNSKEIILKIVNLFDNGIEIDDNVCDVVFMVDNSYRKQILELIKYYPNKLRNYKIIPSKGYVKDNIQVLSLLANQMKSNATPEELVKFSKNVLKIYDLI